MPESVENQSTIMYRAPVFQSQPKTGRVSGLKSNLLLRGVLQKRKDRFDLLFTFVGWLRIRFEYPKHHSADCRIIESHWIYPLDDNRPRVLQLRDNYDKAEYTSPFPLLILKGLFPYSSFD
jgi:hypothetical protein